MNANGNEASVPRVLLQLEASITDEALSGFTASFAQFAEKKKITVVYKMVPQKASIMLHIVAATGCGGAGLHKCMESFFLPTLHQEKLFPNFYGSFKRTYQIGHRHARAASR